MTYRDVRPLFRPPPPGWRIILDYRHQSPPIPPSIACLELKSNLRVITSIDIQRDNKAWLHVSMSHADRLPSYEEMVAVKRLFVGDDITAYQVFPPIAEHVNLNSYCLHLWACLDGRVTPNFCLADGQI